MLKWIGCFNIWLSLFISTVAMANVDNSLMLPAWQLPAGKTYFNQEKNIAQLPVPLHSQGYLQLIDDTLIWHTTTPVDSKLRISSAGVSQWQQQDYVALAGSEFVGQLMLAVLQGQQAFIQQHFTLQAAETRCINLIPLQAPLNQLFKQITLCGEQQLEQMTLIEKNTSTTTIKLNPASAIP